MAGVKFRLEQVLKFRKEVERMQELELAQAREQHETARERLKLSGPKGAKGMRAAAYLPGGERIVSVTFEETIQLWDATKGTLLATTSGMDKGVRSMVLSTDGKTLATCGEDKVIKLWDMPSGAKEQ